MSGTPQRLIDALKGSEARPLDVAYHCLLNYRQTERSIAGCHTPGLDSVVLYDQPDGMIRFYYAHGGEHNLHRLIGPDGHFTVGIHNHKYEIAKLPLVGPLVNVTMDLIEGPFPDRSQVLGWTGSQMWEYGFKSALQGGGMETYNKRFVSVHLPQPTVLSPGEKVVMAPEDLHTVVVPEHTDSAWMVIEGPPVEIEPLIYSPRPGLKLDPTGLYEPMDADTAEDRIRQVLLQANML